MAKNVLRWMTTAILAVGLGSVTHAQSTTPAIPAPPPPGRQVFVVRRGAGMGDATFAFAGVVGDFEGKIIKDAPFSADVTRETVQVLADGNRIQHRETGRIARDARGRTRREMTLPAIGPWAAAGQVPQLVFIRDNVAGRNYILDENKKVAFETRLRVGRVRWKRLAGRKFAQVIQKETKTESLGTKRMDGLSVEGTRTTRTIPAGRIGNEKPITVTTERWYSPDLQTTVSLTRTDPRFGTTTYRLTNITRANPPQALFTVPRDYQVKKGRRFRIATGGPPPPQDK